MFRERPCVYLVGREYQIVFNTDEYGIAWAEVDGERFPDESNGLLISESRVHRCPVPAEKLDRAGRYRVCFRSLPERRPYWPKLGETEWAEFAFRPALGDELDICHVADSHSRVDEVVSSVLASGVPDLLILNGDIPAESKTEADLMSIFAVAGGVTGGERPVVYVRGNHDLRGRLAAELIRYIGTDQGRTYYTFRTGGLWGIALDCGEDKLDTSEEYGGIVCCAPLRRRQIAFLRDVIVRREREYAAPGVNLRVGICHVPFMTSLQSGQEIFDIERDVYGQWTELLNGMGLDLMLTGHMHTLHSIRPGDEAMRYGCNFPVIVGSLPKFVRNGEEGVSRFVCARVRTKAGGYRVDFEDNLSWSERAMDYERH